MREKMKEDSDALCRSFMEKGFPYFSYRFGEKARGITRIGRWESASLVDNEWKKRRHNVTPKKVLKIMKTFARYERQFMEFHLWLEPLPENERNEWRLTFADENVIFD